MVDPLMNQLKQGASPEMLARSVAWGALLGVFPILGTTMTLCAIAGVVLRLNHIALQTVNWLVYPVQFLLIIPFLQLGNALFGLDPVPLSIDEITARFNADFIGACRDMVWLALRAIVAWAVVALPSILAIRLALTPFFRRCARMVGNKGQAV